MALLNLFLALFLSVSLFVSAAALPSAALSERRSLLSPDVVNEFNLDTNSTHAFSTDYGHLSRVSPDAVQHPSSPADIAALIRHSALVAAEPFPIAARGAGHCIRGQAFSPGGVVIDMAALGRAAGVDRITVHPASADAPAYVDAGGEQLWIDVLRATLPRGLAPRSWTDFLYLTVGGTLSNAGISGQAFRVGPQISNVYELDVVTGRGEMITCSRVNNSDLFYGALGGLGQLGVITRARIALERAPERVRWVRLFYSDFSSFTSDQELLISLTANEGFDYVEGQVLMGHKGVDDDSFFSKEDAGKIAALAAQFDIIYMLEGAAYYDSATSTIDELNEYGVISPDFSRHDALPNATRSRCFGEQKVEVLLNQRLNFLPGFSFSSDVSYSEFLGRVPDVGNEAATLHPWLNLFVPRSRIMDFHADVYKGILNSSDPTGLVLLYPLNRNKWDERMSAMTPAEGVFYGTSLLRLTTAENWKNLDDQNEEILRLCEREGIQIKQYLPNHKTQENWMKHFGAKWNKFAELKRKFDPKALLSPGQCIFSTKL